MRKLLIFAVAACGAYASAATEGTVKSEYFYQTDADKNDATPALGYTSSTTKFKGAGTTKEETTATVLNVNYERGINDMFSAGASIGYVSGKTDNPTFGVTDGDNKGLDDLKIFGKGNYPLAAGSSINYGATINYSIGKKKIETDSIGVNSGGAGITPYVGYQMLMGSNVIGTRLQTGMDLMKSKWEDSTSTPAQDIDVSGGHRTILTGFYEAMVGGGTWGGELGWWGDATAKGETSAGSTEFAGQSGYSVAGYTRYDVTEGAQIVGRLAFENALSDHPTGNSVPDSESQFMMNVGGRFTF